MHCVFLMVMFRVSMKMDCHQFIVSYLPCTLASLTRWRNQVWAFVMQKNFPRFWGRICLGVPLLRRRVNPPSPSDPPTRVQAPIPHPRPPMRALGGGGGG